VTRAGARPAYDPFVIVAWIAALVIPLGLN
jgi:hypothetical protein